MSTQMQRDLGAYATPFGEPSPMPFGTPEGLVYGKRALEMARDLKQARPPGAARPLAPPPGARCARARKPSARTRAALTGWVLPVPAVPVPVYRHM